MNTRSFADKLAVLAKKRSVTLPISIVLTAGAIGFLVARIIRSYGEFKAAVLAYPAGSIVGCSVLFVIVLLLEACLWHETLIERTGKKSEIRFLRSLRVFSISSMAKYIPGKIWVLFLQSSMLTGSAISIQTTAKLNVSLAIYALLAALGVGFFFLLFLPVAHGVKVVAVIVIAVLACAPIAHPALRRDRYGRKMVGFCVAWVLYACGGVILGQSQLAGGWAPRLQIVVGMVLSWLVGALALLAPGGLGVREAVFYMSLANLPEGLRLSLPVMTRLCSMIADATVLLLSLMAALVESPEPNR